MFSTQSAVIADLYRQGEQIIAVVLDYDPMTTGIIQVDGQAIYLPQNVFTLIQLSPSFLGVPPQK